MRNPVVVAAIAALAIGCSDSKTAAVSDRALGPSADFGTPPPPPFPGGGDGDFQTGLTSFPSVSALSAAMIGAPVANACPIVHATFRYTSRFFENKPGTNAWFEVRINGSNKAIRFHETHGKMVSDAKGVIDLVSDAGVPFTFQFSSAEGPLFGPEGFISNHYHFLFTGILTINGQSCQTSAGIQFFDGVSGT